MNRDQLIEDLRADEGEVLHAYQDHLGFWTIGIGILIDPRRGGSITKEESAYLLGNRIDSTVRELKRRLPWFECLAPARQGALANMAYQMGVAGLMGFKNSLRFIEQGDFNRAADNLKQSLWYRQTPNRAKLVIEQIRTGRHRNGTD